MKLGVTEYIDCAHHLPGHERCGSLHGHTYQVDVFIEGESRGDFAAALPHYEKLTASGSALDRVGIHQALARCNEKLGRLRDAGTWRRKAGQGYLALSDDEMARDERQYLALVEYRNAVQDLHEDPSLPAVAEEYAAVLKDNFSGGAGAGRGVARGGEREGRGGRGGCAPRGAGGDLDDCRSEGRASGRHVARGERNGARRGAVKPPRSYVSERTIPGPTRPRRAATAERLRGRCLPPAGDSRARIPLLEPPRRVRKRTSVLPV